MLKKTGKGYYAASKKGRKLSKKPKSKRAAMKQLVAVELSKRERKKK